MRRRLSALLCVVSALCCGAATASAAVIDIARYHLGEADTSFQSHTPPHVGDTVATTVDSVGGLNLSGTGSYVAVSNPGTGSPSNLAVSFSAGQGLSSSATLASAPTNNFGIEAYVSLTSSA